MREMARGLAKGNYPMEASEQPCVVVVDDEQPVLDVMRLKLNAAGFDVHVATNGHDGWALIQQLEPRVAIIDYYMADINGVEVCQRMLDHEATADIPVIAITSKYETQAQDMQAMENVVEFVPKPFSSRKLISLVRKLAGIMDPTPRWSD